MSIPAAKDSEFTSEQKEYLKGFFSGIKEGGYLSEATNRPSVEAFEENVYGTPIEDLCKEEKIKYEKNGLDCWQDMVAHAKEGKLPQGADVFRFKFHGLFYVGPAQESFMLRCRIPGGQLQSHQLRGLALMSKELGNGYLDITTRNNIQVREIPPENIIEILTTLYDLGLTSKGSGADNIRNITASPTAGFDPQEIIDVMPYAKDMHHHILGHRELYGLPRKFNIAFDGGGKISACADTNDIAFYAVEVPEGSDFEAGIYFRVMLGGITGHKQFATDTGIMAKGEDCSKVADAMLRVFMKYGDRTNRKKSRLKYLIDNWGLAKFMDESEKEYGSPFIQYPLEKCVQRPRYNKIAHIGVHPQKQADKSYIGVVTPVGRISTEQAISIAKIADQYGDSEIRLTAWQNLLIPHISNSETAKVAEEILMIGLDVSEKSANAGLVACTGNAGCKFAAANTKLHAKRIGAHMREHLKMDSPVNIHVTGCHHSCAQHYCGDIGLIATKVSVDGQSHEGYNILLGGGVDDERGLGREIYKNITAEEAPDLVTRIYKSYQDNRREGETFVEYTRRNEMETLQNLIPVAL